MATRQPPKLSEKQRRIDALARMIEPDISAAWLKAMEAIQSAVVLSEIERVLVSGSRAAINALFSTDAIQLASVDFIRALEDSFFGGGIIEADYAKAEGLVFDFGRTDPVSAAAFNAYRIDKIKEMSKSGQEMISEVLRRTVDNGINPIDAAREIRASIGLTASQDRWVQNYRRALETLDRGALERELRDARFDRITQRAIDAGKPLTKEKVEQLVAAYRRRLTKYRSETIARTESITMLQKGQNAFWDQAIRSGKVRPEQIVRRWVPTMDAKTRDAHAGIPSLNPNGVAWGQPFRSALGVIYYPGDPNASAGNRINCRCTIYTEVKK